MADFKESPSQTAGPYVHIGCMPSFAGLKGMYGGRDPGDQMVTGDVAGTAMTLTGCVYDGEGVPLFDAMVEIWQAGPDGTFNPPGFASWGRQPASAEDGSFSFDTLKPGKVGEQSSHILIWIVARGINLGLMTRAYFPDEDNSRDPVFTLAGDRAETLLCTPTQKGYHLDIHLQGPNETVFFDV